VTKILTYSGVVFDLLVPKAEDVRLDDLLIPMSGQIRFNGHTERWINLLEHSKLVFDLVGYRAKPYALLHDAHEPYVGDITTPVQRALSILSSGEMDLALGSLKDRIDVRVFEAFGLPYPSPDVTIEVRDADRMALSIERQTFRDPGPAEIWEGLPDPLSLPLPIINRAQFEALLRTWCPKVPA
jgi:hypothetical protein